MSRTATKTKSRAAGPKIAKTQAVAVRRHSGAITTGSPADMLRVIASAAENPKIDPAKMSALLDVQERIAKEQARRAFTAAKLAMRPDLPIINRDGKIEILAKGTDGQRVAGRDRVQQSTPYATFENIMDKIDRILQRHSFDLFFTTEPTADGNRIVVIGHLVHADGHSETTRFPLPAESSGSKNNVQAWMSSLSYGKRGCTIALLNLRTYAPQDSDRDGLPSPEPQEGQTRVLEGEVMPPDDAKVNPDQLMKLDQAIHFCGIKAKVFCEAYNIEKTSDLPARLFDAALQRCRSHAEKAAQQR